MSKKERSDIPNWVLSLGERVQETSKKVPLNWFINALAGSSSPNYVQAEWHSVDHVLDAKTHETEVLPIAFGDPDASLLAVISRLKHQAAVLGSNVDEINTLIEDYKAIPAVAYTYRGKTRVGTLPRGIFEFSISASSMHYQAGIRMGRNDVPAGIGAWLPQERVLLKPRDSIIKAQNFPIDKFSEEFPGTPLV